MPEMQVIVLWADSRVNGKGPIPNPGYDQKCFSHFFGFESVMSIFFMDGRGGGVWNIVLSGEHCFSVQGRAGPGAGEGASAAFSALSSLQQRHFPFYSSMAVAKEIGIILF